MKNIGVPAQFIGIPEKEGKRVFLSDESRGGENIGGVGINVDAGVLLATLVSVPSWRNATLKDRIDAVIAHEYEELQFLGFPSGHRNAIQKAPETVLNISEGARRILREIRTLEEEA